MTEQQLDAQGEAHDALSTAVDSYGQRVLSDPHILGNLVTDLLPDQPRERHLLVAAAEADVAGELRQHVEEQHLDPDTAVRLVASSLSDRRSIDPAASMWVATEYAQVLGYPVQSGGQPGPPPGPPAGPPLVTPPVGAPPPVVPVTPPTMTAVSGPGQATYPPAGVPPVAPPPWQQAGGTGSGVPSPPKRSGRGPLISAVAIGAVIVLYLAVAAVAHIAPFPKASPKPTPTPAPVRSHVPTPTPSTSPAPASSLAAGVAPLVQLLPADLDDPATQCHPFTPSFTVPGLTQALSCVDPGLPGGLINAYQVNSSASYTAAWAAYNKWWGFDNDTPGSACPPASTNTQAEGTTGWNDKLYPAQQGQVLECEWVGSGSTLNEPSYTWTYPTEDAFIVAQGAPNSAFSALDSWWTDNAEPLAAPTPAVP